MTRRTPGERWYRRLLRLYPQDFRDEFGGEMARLYRDRCRQEPWWRLWGSLIVDVARTAPSEHLSLLRQDLRYAKRSLVRTPIVTLTAMLTLALGVGASTAVYSVVHSVLMRPLPYPEPDRLVEMFEDTRLGVMRVSALNYLSWAERSQRFEAIGAFGNAVFTRTDGGDPELIGASLVTASYFRVLGLPPILGRTLQPDDERRGAARVVLLGESLWRSRFGADGAVLGRALTLNGERYEIVGVMPRTFREVGRAQASGATEPQIVLPLIIDPAHENRANHTLRVAGRVRDEAGIDQARDEMRAVAAGLEQEFPATNRGCGVRIEPLSSTTLDPLVRRSLLLMLGAVMLVFVIASANVANLMLARGARRRAELAVRTALGAGRSRLVRQLLTESACLAAISGTAGVIVAAATHPMVRALLPPSLPRLDEMRLDATVLAFGLALSIVSGIAFGLVPALRATRLDLSQSLAHLGRSTPASSRVRLRQLLVAVQLALATMLLVGAGLLLQGFVRLQQVPLGFAPEDVLTLRLSLPGDRSADAPRIAQFYDSLLASLRESGGARAAATGTSAPFAPGVRASFGPPPGGGSAQAGAEHIVSADYFRALGIPLLAGRSIADTDKAGSPLVAVVSQRLARAFWPNAHPLGRTIERAGRTYEVVGVVGDVRGSDVQGPRGGGPDREPRAAAYFAAGQQPQRSMTLVILPNGEPAGVIAAIRETVRQLDPAMAIPQVRPLAAWLDESVASTRLTTTLAGMFALTALLLTSVGIYGVLAYSVASRTREIGVRLAIGATRRRVVGLVVREGMTWAAVGIAAGLVGAFAAARLIAVVLFEVSARDPITFAIVGVVVGLAALTASVIPAGRAVRIDPTIAMRVE
jgi:putative ABC transport system permease protein